MTRALIVLLALLCWANPIPAEPTPQQIPEAFRRDIVHLMEITGASQMGLRIGAIISQQMYTTLHHIRPNLPGEASEVMDEVAFQLFDGASASLHERVIPIYARHFTHAEVQELIQLYETPIGKKLIHVMPLVMEEAVQETRVWSRDVHPKLEPLVLKRFKEEGLLSAETQALFRTGPGRPEGGARPGAPSAAPPASH